MTFYHIAVIINSFLEENNIIYDVWDCPGRGRWIVTGLSRLNWNSKQSWDIRKLLASQPNIAIKSGDMPLREIHLWKLSWAGLHCQFSIWHKSYFEWTTTRGTALNVSPWRAIWASLLLFQPPLISITSQITIYWFTFYFSPAPTYILNFFPPPMLLGSTYCILKWF